MKIDMFFIILAALLLFTRSSSSSRSDDFNVLVELKRGFRFPEPSLSTWNSSSPDSVCLSWRGVRCSKGRVVSIDFTGLDLQGSVSPLISRLNQLIELSLSGNNFSGPIDAAVSNITNLRWLNISNNQFLGKLEDLNFSTLQVLDAYNNNFTGSLPLGLVALDKLEFLNLGGNYFGGKIPSSYGSFSELRYLSLAGNNLVGKIPCELGNLTNLREIYLGYYNVFEGGIPRELGNLQNLVHMDLSSCGLDGGIPRELGDLKLLNTLYLHINVLSGPIPRELGNLTGLANLDLSLNSLSGEIPLEFNSLGQLRVLNLYMNQLHGSIPDFVSDLGQLESLELWMNNFTGTIPRNLGGKSNLQRLDLSSNKLTGTIPPDLCSSNQLEVLILFKNFLFGPIPQGLGSCPSLVRVRLGKNYLNGNIPEGFIYLPKLNLMELDSNNLSGTLSEQQLSITNNGASLNHVVLDLSNNLFSGPLPSSLSNLSNLQTLLIGRNRFSGPIPSSIGELRQAVKLDLNQNLFSGTIPKEIGNLYHLTYLDLSGNNLSGPIPPEISNIHVLNYLNLSRNHLNRTIPRIIGSMKSLTVADFAYNDFSGEVPNSGQFSIFNTSSFIGNPRLCGSIMTTTCNNSTTNKSGRPYLIKLIVGLSILTLSLAFAAAAVIKANSLRRNKAANSSWKMTTFQKLDFGALDVLDCLKDDRNVIGRGGAGIVYHAKMPTGVEVAVKKLEGIGTGSHDRGFRAEIQTLGNIRHRNIVRLVAFCTNKETNLLVYEYMKNGSLGEALHGKRGGAILGWDLRYKVAIEAAKGLSYLHHDCSPMIVHRDVKSNNILLSSSYEAHVADFGLAKFLTGRGSECMSAIAGSYGYIAPEYAYTLRVDEKSDVYSFGVVLLELLTGRRPVGDFGDGVDIVQWAKVVTKGRKEEVNRIVDPRLALVPRDEAMHMFFIAMLCIHDNSVERPTMREIVQMLSEFHRHSSNNYSSSSSSSNHGSYTN